MTGLIKSIYDFIVLKHNIVYKGNMVRVHDEQYDTRGGEEKRLT